MSKIYKFPIDNNETGRNVGGTFFTAFGSVLILIHVFGIFQGFPVYFGWLPFLVGLLIFGVKRDVTIDMTTGTIKTVKGFYFLVSTNMYQNRDFEEIYIRRMVSKSNSDSISSRDSTSYHIILNGRELITVDSFPDRESAMFWVHELADALQLKYGQERNDNGSIDENIPVPTKPGA
ncbi:hypothetical protein [Fulvivirga sp.]|uniref:hypothetical protein n=1 Tax=Fulvivirga sp. TaxID=1931237 RepID=UPI0032EE49BB